MMVHDPAGASRSSWSTKPRSREPPDWPPRRSEAVRRGRYAAERRTNDQTARIVRVDMRGQIVLNHQILDGWPRQNSLYMARDRPGLILATCAVECRPRPVMTMSCGRPACCARWIACSVCWIASWT